MNIVFPRLENQGVPQSGELFISWAVLHEVCIYTIFHILSQLEDEAKSQTSVIAFGGIVIALARDLVLRNLFPIMPILRQGGGLNLEACAHMEIFSMLGS